MSEKQTRDSNGDKMAILKAIRPAIESEQFGELNELDRAFREPCSVLLTPRKRKRLWFILNFFKQKHTFLKIKKGLFYQPRSGMVKWYFSLFLLFSIRRLLIFGVNQLFCLSFCYVKKFFDFLLYFYQPRSGMVKWYLSEWRRRSRVAFLAFLFV